ncbi:MAG: YbjN domain-containing protein [Pseudomonadota bacterium]
MKPSLMVLIAVVLLAGACSAAQGPKDPDGFLGETGAADTERLMILYQKSDFQTGWIKPGKVFWITHDEMPGKVLFEVQEKTKSLRVATVYKKRAESAADPQILMQVNTINYKGYVKVYLDKDGDFWTEMFYPYRKGLSEDSLMVFTRQFARYSQEAAKAMAHYLK